MNKLASRYSLRLHDPIHFPIPKRSIEAFILHTDIKQLPYEVFKMNSFNNWQNAR